MTRAELFIPWDELTDLRLERDTWKRMAQRLATENKDLMMRLVIKENQCRWCDALKERDGLAAELERMKKGLRDAAPDQL
jgi:hypothetical protein